MHNFKKEKKKPRNVPNPVLRDDVNDVHGRIGNRGSLASQLAAMSNYVALILSLATPALAGAASTSQQKALPIDEARPSASFSAKVLM